MPGQMKVDEMSMDQLREVAGVALAVDYVLTASGINVESNSDFARRLHKVLQRPPLLPSDDELWRMSIEAHGEAAGIGGRTVCVHALRHIVPAIVDEAAKADGNCWNAIKLLAAKYADELEARNG